MKKLLINIVLFIPALVWLHSCKPDKPEPGQTNFPVPQEVKDYMYFKQGTYWIYKDSVSEAIDTVRVYDSYFDSQTTDGSYFEEVGTKSYSSFEGYTYHTFVNTSFSDNCLRKNGNACYKVMLSKFKPGDYVGELLLMYYGINVGDYGYGATDKTKVTIIDFKDSLILNNRTFKGIVITNTVKNYLFDNSITIFYVAKNVGIVRKEILTKNQVWKLIDYNINQ